MSYEYRERIIHNSKLGATISDYGIPNYDYRLYTKIIRYKKLIKEPDEPKYWKFDSIISEEPENLSQRIENLETRLKKLEEK